MFGRGLRRGVIHDLSQRHYISNLSCYYLYEYKLHFLQVIYIIHRSQNFLYMPVG